jgi:signal transduction histidine kinase
MAERARLAGGTLRAGQVDDGWSVEVRLPVPAG